MTKKRKKFQKKFGRKTVFPGSICRDIQDFAFSKNIEKFSRRSKFSVENSENFKMENLSKNNLSKIPKIQKIDFRKMAFSRPLMLEKILNKLAILLA